MRNVSELVGKTLVKCEQRDDYGDQLWFVTDKGDEFYMYHSQDCCENVGIEDIVGDLSDLIGTPILYANEVSNIDAPAPNSDDFYSDDCNEWTFYNFGTIKGSVTLRWFGSSNGYYSTSVSFDKVKKAV